MKLTLFLLASPVIAMLVMVAVSMIAGRFKRRHCPACMQRGLKKVSFVRAEVVEGGVEKPDYRTYLLCEHCGERFKLHNGVLSGVPQDEMAEATRFG